MTGPTSGTYAPGNSVTINWTAANVSSNDVISLCLDKDTTFWNGNEQWIEVDKVTASNGNGSYTFNMPNVAAGTYFIGGYMYDKATYAFTYSHVASTVTVPAKSFTLTSPTSGNYAPGDFVTITWTATNVSSNDVISLCLDKDTTLWNGNEKWIEIDQVSAANGNGSYTFNTAGSRRRDVLRRRIHVQQVTIYVHQFALDSTGQSRPPRPIHNDRSHLGDFRRRRFSDL